MMAKTENEEKIKIEKVVEKTPELITNRGRVRSKEDEEALDRKIAEIRRKNQLIEQRKEKKTVQILSTNMGKQVFIVDQEDQSAQMYIFHQIKKKSGQCYVNNNEKRLSKPKRPGEWDREWDAGKISVENWKENVPDIDNNKGPNAHFLRGFKNRDGTNRRNFSNATESKKVAAIKKKQKLQLNKFAVTEINKKVSLSNKKLFDGKNSKTSKKDFGNGTSGDGTLLRSTHLMKPVSRLKPFHASSNGETNKQPIVSKKPFSGSSRRRYSNRRAASNTAVSLPAVSIQHLDTVKVNVPMLGLKKTIELVIKHAHYGQTEVLLHKVSLEDEMLGLKSLGWLTLSGSVDFMAQLMQLCREDAKAITKSNNNVSSDDNNQQKLSTTAVVCTVTASSASVLPDAKEYGS
uniref:Uncharacterized protein n=1 Tax=Setaria digitata TaxID=48799 RepID=A0A915PK43_9BILA